MSTSKPFSAREFWVQVSALREALESGAIAHLTPEEHSHLRASINVVRYLDGEGCFEAEEQLQALARVVELTSDDDAPAPLVTQ
jgi:hypothetical protein